MNIINSLVLQEEGGSISPPCWAEGVAAFFFLAVFLGRGKTFVLASREEMSDTREGSPAASVGSCRNTGDSGQKISKLTAETPAILGKFFKIN